MHEMSTRRPRVVPLVALAALAASGCVGRSNPTANANPTEVRIGLIATASGVNRGAGIEAERGAQLAADVVNGPNSLIPLPLANDTGLPNLGNARIKIVAKDVGSGPDAGTDAANVVTTMATTQGVSAIVGGYDAEVTVKASQRAERIPIPFVNADSSVGFLTERGLDWFFRLGPSDRSAGEAFFSLLKQAQANGKSISRLAIIHATDKAGNGADTVVKELAEEGGFQPPIDESFKPDATDVTAVVGKVQQQNPDVVFLAPTPGTVPVLWNAFLQKRYKPPVAMAYSSGFIDTSFLKAVPQAAAGLCREVAWSHDLATRNDAARAVSDLYERKYNGQMTEEAAGTFTAVLTLAIAINNAGSTSAKAIRSALLNLNIAGRDTIMPWAGIQFDETHQNSGANTVVEQFIDKSFRVVYPLDAAAAHKGFVYPAPGATSAGSQTAAGGQQAAAGQPGTTG
jgi:branched-chain amino acid transport system substrate-binding protein